jgi:hypothetical protein
MILLCQCDAGLFLYFYGITAAYLGIAHHRLLLPFVALFMASVVGLSHPYCPPKKVYYPTRNVL